MKKGFSGNALKLIAVITMFIDHIGAVIVERALILYGGDYALYERLLTVDGILRSIGRISFPIYCFLLVEGFLHTKNIGKYMLRLALSAFISEIPFNLALTGKVINPYYQNIFFTLLTGLIVIYGVDRIWSRERQTKVLRICLCIFVVCAGTFFAEFANMDYGAMGILPIVVLYLFRHNRFNQAIAGVIAFSWEFPAPFAYLPVLAYNGQRGKGNKYLFYIFYPVHLLILYLVAFGFGLV